MWAFRRLRTKKTPKNVRLGLLIWAAVVGVIFSSIDLGEPLENFLHTLRNRTHMTRASGEIVVVGVDDYSVEKLGRWPWPRTTLARIIDNLNANGARQILLDIDVGGTTNPVDDQALAMAIRRASGKIVLPVRFVISPVTGRRVLTLPSPVIRQQAKLANVNNRYNFVGEFWRMPFALVIEGKLYPSMAAMLAGTESKSEKWFPIDNSIDVKTIPEIPAFAIYANDRRLQEVRGKKVIIGLSSIALNDVYKLAGQGIVAGVFSHVIGAETLRRGAPVELSSLLFCCLMFLFSLGIVVSKRITIRVVSMSCSIVAAIVLPILLDVLSISTDYVPGMAILAIAWIGHIRISGQSKATLTNPVSGLSNLNALRQTTVPEGKSLTVARIRNFPEISSSLNPELESLLVEQIANRFAMGIGGSELYQGDEGVFAWFSSITHDSSIGDQLDGLHALLTTPVVVDNRKIDLAVTFGIDADAERSVSNRIGSALVAADEAAGKGLKWKGHDPTKLQNAEWNLSLLGRLDEAIDNGEVWVAYQPKLDIRSGRIIGAEALVRWNHPERGEINPDEFIPIVEQHGRIEKLTLHVLDSAIRTAVAINSHGIKFNIAVNLSARLLENPYLAETIINHLKDYDLDPTCLTLEVTESIAIGSSGTAIRFLDELRGHGIQISIDDYGTGFSTLEYFRKIPATEIKIDKSFISLVTTSISDRYMVNSTIQLAHQLDRKVVAEGVETVETLHALTAMGCDQAQGYLIGRPVRFISLAKALLREQVAAAA